MPVYQDDAGLAGWLEAGRDQRLATEGKQRMAVENLMHKNRLEEGMTEVPTESVHPNLREGMMPGTSPNTLRVRVTALPSLEKASENIYGRETRVSSAKSLIKSMLDNAQFAEGPQRNALLAHAANLQSLTEGTGVRDVPQSAIDMANKLLETKMIMGKPGETPVNERTGVPGKPLPLPDLSTIAGASTTGGPMKPPSLKVGTSGAEISLNPMGDATQNAHAAAISRGLKPGTQAYNDFILDNTGPPPVALRPDEDLYSRGGFGRGPIASRLPTASSQDIDENVGNMSWIKNAEKAADKLDAILKNDSTNRLSLDARQFVSGVPGLRSFNVLSPEEATAIGDAKAAAMLWEKATGGVRMAASPQMYDRVQAVIGNPAAANTPQRLREIAQMMREDMQTKAAKQKEMGRPVTASPPKTTPPTTPQQKGGSAASVGVSGTPTNSMDDKVRAWRQSQGR